MQRRLAEHHRGSGQGTARPERRGDQWAEFLRRILLSASLAGVAGVTPTAADNAPPNPGVVEPDQAGGSDQPGEPPRE